MVTPTFGRWLVLIVCVALLCYLSSGRAQTEETAQPNVQGVAALTAVAVSQALEQATLPRAVESLPQDAKAPAAAAVDQAVEQATFTRPVESPPRDAKRQRQEAYAAGIEEVRQSGIVERALGVGDKSIDFDLPSANGTNVRLSELLPMGPVVLVFYRGGWCPHCNRHLAAMQEVLLELTGLGAQVVAVSPELPDRALATQDKNHLVFSVLSDKANAVARQYGLAFRISDKVIPYYDEFFDIEAYNGDRSYELPLAATYVIGSDGVIRYAYFDADYKRRAKPQDVLDAVQALQPSGRLAGDSSGANRQPSLPSSGDGSGRSEPPAVR